MTIYNPHLLARRDLIDTFVARQPLLAELLEDLRRGGGQHHLLVGGRGTGKTTLLLRLAAAIEDDPALVQRCIPLRFPEEQYNVARPSDFWMNAIDALVDALERAGDASGAHELEASLAELDPLDEAPRATRSLAVLEGWAKRARRLIVLLVDNLDLVLDRLDTSLWELREALSTDNRLVVVGASSKYLDAAIDYQSPFYDFFHVHELGGLSEDEARGLVLLLADRAHTPQVADVLARDPGRFKALYALTGGTPRTLALLHTVLALDDGERADRDLEGLLDQLTPYYKARFDDLPAQSQLVVDKVALHWHPVTAAECQAATHLDLNTVSAQLSRLVKQGVLAKVALPGPKKLGFQISERFFNIWYLMRASRRLRRKLAWFVEFLRIFYGEEDLRRRAEALLRYAPAEVTSSPAKLLAFAAAVTDANIRRELELRAVSLLVAEGANQLRDVLDLAGEDAHLAPVVERATALHEIRRQILDARVRWPRGSAAATAAERLVSNPLVSLATKRALARGLAARTVDVARLTAVDPIVDLGPRLLDAVATGEVPSLPDARTPGELRQFIELARHRGFALTLALAPDLPDHVVDDVARELADSDPTIVPTMLAVAVHIIDLDGGPTAPHGTPGGRNRWPDARRLAVRALRHAPRSPPMAQLIELCARCVAHDLTNEVCELLVETGLADRWAPLYEAVTAAGEGNASRLEALAPELRAAALELYPRLLAPGVTSTGASIAADSNPGSKRRSPPPAARLMPGRGAPAPRGSRTSPPSQPAPPSRPAPTSPLETQRPATASAPPRERGSRRPPPARAKRPRPR